MNQRRCFLWAACGIGGAALAGLAGLAAQRSRALFNNCQAQLPSDPAVDHLIHSAWAGVDSSQFLDCHVHLVGTGDSGSGIEVNPDMESLFHPMQYAQRLFYLNAGCVHDAPGRIDESYVERMQNLVDGLQPGARLLLFAFDRFHTAAGRPDPERSSFYTPNALCPGRGSTPSPLFLVGGVDPSLSRGLRRSPGPGRQGVVRGR
jgi:hypothetical protein